LRWMDSLRVHSYSQIMGPSGPVLRDVGTFGRAFGSAGVVLVINGEFDPGSGRTLAACLTHASRTVNPFGGDQWRTGE
jgi:hypothetical protein